MEMSHISETEKSPQTISFPCPLLFFLSVSSLKSMKQLPLTLVEADTETPEAYVIAVTQYNAGGDNASLIFLQRSKWGMLTAHPVLQMAPIQHRYWSTVLCRHIHCKHRPCGGWPWKNIPEGNYTGAAKSVLASLSWLCCLINPSNFLTWNPNPHQASLCL